MVVSSTTLRQRASAEPRPLVLVAVGLDSLEELIRLALDDIDCIPLAVATSEEAIQMILRVDIDVVVTDLDGASARGRLLVEALGELPVAVQRPEVVAVSDAPLVLKSVAAVVPPSLSPLALAAVVQSLLDDPLQFAKIDGRTVA